MKNSKAVIVFTRVPIAYATKTRLMPYFNGQQCAKLHECMLKDILKQCEDSGADVRIYYTPKGHKEKLTALLGTKYAYFEQRGDSLGEKMENAFADTFSEGYKACLLFGTDVPDLKAKDMKAAFGMLKVKDIVFGPSLDGGYYLIGMKRPEPLAFLGKDYGHGSVLENTLASLRKCHITYGMIRAQQDIDEKKDVEKYRRYGRQNKVFRESCTGRYLAATAKISVIVPVYNEEKTIEALQRQLWPLRKKCEILFVDGGSTDDTVKKIRPQFRVLHSPKGRARQMNYGVINSTGDILFFLHSDSELPQKPLEQIRQVMSKHQAGCFGIAFHSKNFFMWTCRVISNHRIKDRKVMFGDQGIFVDRALFFKAGMFPELPIMEDYQFSLNLKAMGIALGMTKRRIYTSDRRFPKSTAAKLRLMWKMNRLRKMYRDGVDIEKISAMYKDIR